MCCKVLEHVPMHRGEMRVKIQDILRQSRKVIKNIAMTLILKIFFRNTFLFLTFIMKCSKVMRANQANKLTQKSEINTKTTCNRIDTRNYPI